MFKINSVFLLRLLIASALGASIGLEREIKAKEAGIGTHFLYKKKEASSSKLSHDKDLAKRLWDVRED